MFLHEITLWNNEQSLDNTLATKNRGMISESHTFIPWESSFERLLCNYLYNKFVVLRTFESNVHYCLIKDNREVVNTMVYQASLPMCHDLFSLLMPSFSLYLILSNLFGSITLSFCFHLIALTNHMIKSTLLPTKL